MAARTKALILAVFVLVIVRAALQPPGQAQTRPLRIVSIVPSVTEMLFAMGAGPRVVGVSSFDQFPLEVLTRTRVGGLIDPDIERIISLRPDLLVVYGTQNDLRMQMQRAGIPIFPYEHSGLADITQTIRQRWRESRQSARGARRWPRASSPTSQRSEQLVAGRPRPRTLLVFGRDADTLRGIYASGGDRILERHARRRRRHQRLC